MDILWYKDLSIGRKFFWNPRPGRRRRFFQKYYFPKTLGTFFIGGGPEMKEALGCL
jgi:hypothetical protein